MSGHASPVENHLLRELSEEKLAKISPQLALADMPKPSTVDGDARYSYGQLEYKSGSALKGGCHIRRFTATVQARPPAETEDPLAGRKSCIGLTAQVFWIAVSEMTRAGQLGWGAEVFEGVGEMTLNYAGRSHDEAVAARHKQKQKAQEQAGGEMAIDGTECDAEHSCGELSERGKQVWRSGSGINGGGKE